MQEIILVKLGELVLKGLNRLSFENVLLKNMCRRLRRVGEFRVRNVQSTLYVYPIGENLDLDDAVDTIRKVFGVATIARACVCEKSMEDIEEKGLRYLEDDLLGASTFRVNAKRADKTFPLKSPEICVEMGAAILEKYPHLTVDLHNPDLIVTVEVRDFGAYVRGGVVHGPGGMPVGTGGRAALLISGGIDSPVAAWMMAKRGIELTAVHFVSPPYTSERAEQKVVDLLKKVGEYAGRMHLFVVPFTRMQEAIHEHCPEELFTVIMRRYMMKIAEAIAKREDCAALITGESLGQVASQTMMALACTDEAVSMPVFRPLIGMDKEEIVSIARRIDTFEISIQPFEDCCTVFTPKHPRTRPELQYVKKAEEVIDGAAMMEECIENVKIIKIQ